MTRASSVRSSAGINTSRRHTCVTQCVQSSKQLLQTNAMLLSHQPAHKYKQVLAGILVGVTPDKRPCGFCTTGKDLQCDEHHQANSDYLPEPVARKSAACSVINAQVLRLQQLPGWSIKLEACPQASRKLCTASWQLATSCSCTVYDFHM